MINILTEAAKVKDHPPDLINIAIEELVKSRCELPSFRVLDELTGQIRRAVIKSSSNWYPVSCPANNYIL